MPIKKLITLLIFILLVPLTSYGQHSLSLSQAIEMAQEYDKERQVSENELTAAQWEVREARSSALPNINVEGRWQYNPDVPTFGGLSLTNQYEYSTTLSLNQALYTFGTISSAIETANRSLSVREVSKEITAQEIQHKVKVAYYTALLAKEQLSISRSSLQNAQRSLDLLRGYTSSGRVPQQDLLRLQADIAARGPQVTTAQGEYRQALLTLKHLLGLKMSDEVILTSSFRDNLPELDPQQSQQDLLTNEPRLRALRENIKLQESLAETLRVQGRPRLDAFVSRTFSATDDDNIFGSTQKLNATAIGVSLTWNLWDGGARKSRYQQAKIEKGNAQLRNEIHQEQFASNLEKAIVNYETLKESLPAIKRSVDLAQQSFRLSQNRFSSGETTVTELNDVESLLTQNKIKLSMTIYEIHLSLAQIEKLVNEING